uniref:Williams-Beuren syndrome chromosomal region 16 protein homolog n=1 Tax=Schistocephalus solidus TaxID=70667 RepID=A0A0X3P7F7_SCHSO
MPPRVYSCSFYLRFSTCSLLLNRCSVHLSESQASFANVKRPKQLFGFGVAATGALGLKRFIIAEGVIPPPFTAYSPVNLILPGFKQFDVKNVACGFGYSIFLRKCSRRGLVILGCGLNTDGQLGPHPNAIHGKTPVGVQFDLLPEPQVIQLPSDKYVPFAVACGRAHTLVACKPRSFDAPHCIYSFGNNTFGQCARQMIRDEVYSSEHATITQVPSPETVTAVKQLVCGQDHSLVLTEDGLVFSAGLGTDGQTGLGTTDCVDRLTRVRGAIEDVPIEQISSRGDTVLALSRCGRLFAWGNNEYGQIWPISDEVQVTQPVELPLREYVDSVTRHVSPSAESTALGADFKLGNLISIASAGSMCAVVDDFGQVLVWGFGCLGLGPRTYHCDRPRLIPPPLFAPTLPRSEHRIVEVVPGLHHFIARSNAGLLWSWGAPRGAVGCLGLGKLHKVGQPISAKRSDVEIAKAAQTYPAQISLPAEALQVSCGVDHTFVLGRRFG